MVERWRIFGARHAHLLLAVILIVHILLALPIIAQPTWFGHEPDFYTVGRTLLHEKRLPTAADFPDRPGVMLQATQPPLYNAIVMSVLLLFDNNQAVPMPAQAPAICFGWEQVNPVYIQTNDAALYNSGWQNPAVARSILRAINVTMLLGAMLLVYTTARLIAPERHDVALLAAALLAFEPTTLSVTSTIGNDTLLLLISALFVFAATRILTAKNVSVKTLTLFGVTTIGAVVTRLNGWALLPIAGIVILILLRSRVWEHLPRRVRRGVWIGVGVLAVSILAIIVVNFLTTGSLFGRYRELDAVLLASLPHVTSINSVVQVVIAVAHDTSVGSYLTPLGIIGHPRVTEAFGWFTLGILIMAAAGIGITLIRTRRASVLVLVLTVAATVLLVFTRNSAALVTITAESSTQIYAPLRYYVTGLPAAIILIALGLRQIRFARWLGAALAVSWIGISLLSGVTLPIYAQPAPASVLDMPDLASLDHTENVAESYPQIVGDRIVVDSAKSLLNLTLVANAKLRLSENYAGKLEFSTPDGRNFGCQFPLAQALYPTMLWQPSESITTETRIPSCLADLPAQTEVRLRWISDQGESPPVALGQLTEPLTRTSACPPLLGSVDNKLLVTRYTAPLMARAGTLYLPAVNWYVMERSSAYLRTYMLSALDGSGGYTCSGQPRLGTYPFAAWQTGETVFFDECDLHLPADAPPGKYVVSLAVTGAQGNPLNMVDASGHPQTQLSLATIDLLPP